jgi:hypothetical protein
MKRLAPYLIFAIGIVALVVLIPRFNAAQPFGARMTRGAAAGFAHDQARAIGIPVDNSWTMLVWDESALLNKEFERTPERRREAAVDSVIAPRLGSYQANYFRYGLEKFTPWGEVRVHARTGEVLGARLRLRPEDTGANATEQQLRPAADAFVRSRSFPGAPNPQFESARPTVLRGRTDWVFRYRVPSTFPTGNVVPYLYVHFAGDRLTGWNLAEEYADGSPFRGDTGGAVGGFFARLCVVFALLLVLLIIFLRKYHAGEVGVGTASFLFGVVIVLFIVMNIASYRSASEGVGLGTVDARWTALAQIGFKFLFNDIPTAVLIFLAWAVGESYARERWGEKLASFDALLRRDPLNATVGRSVIHGLLAAPAIAAAWFAVAAIPTLSGQAWPTLGTGSFLILALGGPIVALLAAALDSIVIPVVAILAVLAVASRRRVLPLGLALALAIGVVVSTADLPMDPVSLRMLFGFGGIAAAVAIFLRFDLLTTAIAVMGGSLLTMSLPLLSAAGGPLLQSATITLAAPFVLLLVFAIPAVLSGREIAYQYEDMAPHVKRIVERERVKAEIDAANRIQAALLPLEAPTVAGASVASHYRAATEIGGDYFDFLPQPTGEIGIAFGDVSGHGLTSGIVMAMAKAALLVQVDTDSSPRVVLSVLNDVVMKTAPKRIMMTFFYGMLDPHSQQLRFSSAGHLDPYVYRAATKQLESLSSWGYPLGVRRREPFREHVVDFAAGDRLILYSDGLIEAVDDDGEPYGFDRFEKTLIDSGHLNAEEIKKTLLASVRKFTRNRPPEDDQTLVVVSFDEALAQLMPAASIASDGYSEPVN